MCTKSNNRRPEIREMFAWAEIETVGTATTLAGGEHAAKAAELLIGKGLELTPAARQGRLS